MPALRNVSWCAPLLGGDPGSASSLVSSQQIRCCEIGSSRISTLACNQTTKDASRYLLGRPVGAGPDSPSTDGPGEGDAGRLADSAWIVATGSLQN